jgi:hypothetical protein
MIFKRGAAPAAIAEINKGSDSEKQLTGPPMIEEKMKLTPQISASANITKSTDIFTWSDVRYDVDIKGSKRRLLDNVSGYVAPGSTSIPSPRFQSNYLCSNFAFPERQK